MNKCSLIFSLAAIMLGAATVNASPNDPQGVFQNFNPNAPFMPVTDFLFGADASGGGIFSFQNVSPNDWVAMDFFVTEPASIAVTCDGGPFFDTCDSSFDGTTGQWDIHFGSPINGGLPAGTEFSFNLNNDTSNNIFGAGGWGPGADFNVIPTNGAPEPASWLLLAGGIALLGFLRRRTA